MAIAVILDVDGTLMDTNYLHVEAWARALLEVGHPAPRAVIHRQIGKGSDRLLPEFIDDEATRGRANELHSRYYAGQQRGALPLPGAKDLLASLVRRGCGVWLATSAKPDELEPYLEALEARDRVAGIVSSADVDESKPSPDIFELALERAGASAADALAVGDTVWDVESARRIGLRTVAVLTGGAFSRAELEQAGAVAVYRDCAEILEAGFPEVPPDGASEN